MSDWVNRYGHIGRFCPPVGMLKSCQMEIQWGVNGGEIEWLDPTHWMYYPSIHAVGCFHRREALRGVNHEYIKE